ncbi:MAG TPA: CAP domain-containing protein [Tabrizicola sp.]|nr:CAP domain-containing protein [Tabrizicola sp.]
MLRRTTYAALAAAALLCLGSAAQAGCAIPPGSDAMQKELLTHLNAERKARGLPALVLSAKLDKAAQGHACDNAKRKSISHTSSDGGTLKTRLRKAGYAFRTAAENTGRGFATGARAIEWWMHSPRHKDNILLRKAREVGVGIAVSPAPDNKLHWIIVVGASK